MKKTNFSCKIVFVIIFFIGVHTLKAQTILPSPDAQNQMRGKSANVSYYTGTLNYQIPLFTIKEGDITVPITLSYSGGGVKPTEVPSWCGLGWSVNAGGLINRVVMGQPDETPETGYIDYYCQGRPVMPDKTAQSDNRQNIQWNDINQGRADGEPDLYYFSVPGFSGRMLRDADGRLVCSPSQQICAGSDTSVYTSAPNMLFTNKLNYTFIDAPSETHTHIERLVNPSDIDGPNYYIDTVIYSTNSWYLDNIHSWQGNDVYFHYDNFNYGTPVDVNNIRYYRELNEEDNMFLTPFQLQEQYNSAPRIKEIEFSSGKVKFIPTQHIRYDLPVAGSFALDKIVIENSDGQIVKQYKLEYDYWKGDYNTASALVPFENLLLANETNLPALQSSNFDCRLMLRSITELDSSGSPIDGGVLFEYNTDVCFPIRNNKDYTDYWGYFNNKSHTNLGTAAVQNPWYYHHPTGNYVVPMAQIQTTFDLSSLQPDESYAKKGSLKKITLPTGATEEITYEGNGGTYPTGLQPIEPSGGPGIRVSTIYRKENNTSPDNEGDLTVFYYSNGACSTIPVNNATFNAYNPNVQHSQIYEVLNINGFVPDDGKIGYGNVTVENYKGKFVDAATPIGKEVYNFETPHTQTNYTALSQNAGYTGYAFNAPFDERSSWMQGSLLSHETYVWKDNDFVLKNTENISYDMSRVPLASGVRLDPYIPLAFSKYTYYTGSRNPLSNDNTEFDIANQYVMQNHTYFEYTATNYKNNPSELSTIQRVFPNGSQQKEHFVYASSFTGLPISDNDPYDYAFYFRRFRSLPVEHVVMELKNGSDLLVTGAQLYTYTESGDVESVQEMQGFPFSGDNFHFSNTGGSFNPLNIVSTPTPDTHYHLTKKMRWNLLKWDGGLNESIDLTTGDTTTYISWLSRYNSSFLNGKGSPSGYPSAIILGATFDEVVSHLNPSSWSSEAALNTDVNNLRSILPSCNITTTTYRPIIGALSIKEPDGNVSYFDYDKSGRLKFQRDRDGNYLNSYEYHSKQ